MPEPITRTLGEPAQLRRRLIEQLHPANIQITPRDTNEIQAYYASDGDPAHRELEAALAAIPGVYLTTQATPTVLTHGFTVKFSNADWPIPLGVRRRDRDDLRRQVIALIRPVCEVDTAQPATPRCGYCRKQIHEQRSGEWYHDGNGSVACHPGSGDGRKAFPAGVGR